MTTRVKRRPMQVSPSAMDLFKECHRETKAKSIGQSVAQTIKRLRSQVQHLRAENTDLKARLDVGDLPTVQGPPSSSLQPEVGEPSKKPEASLLHIIHPSQQCMFYSLLDGIVHCSKDYDRKGIIHRVTEDVCDQCWQRIQKPKQEQHMHPSIG